MAAVSLRAFARSARGKEPEPVQPPADAGLTEAERRELLRLSTWMEEHCAAELAQVRAAMARAAGARHAA